ncbi:hypothetical protein HY250_01650 [Candidatus Azambacteria bacterium]|nr:hypothetical protein [Candidatus Azambacteria bacterium]MBI3685085.1 hypothetical protein [Candidatus Azambacteria bacterium]
MISRRDDENVLIGTLRRSNKEISHFLASFRAGAFGQASSLLVAHDTHVSHRSSRLASCPNALRSIDFVWIPRSCINNGKHKQTVIACFFVLYIHLTILVSSLNE